jgi:hypothetical protein
VTNDVQNPLVAATGSIRNPGSISAEAAVADTQKIKPKNNFTRASQKNDSCQPMKYHAPEQSCAGP